MDYYDKLCNCDQYINKDIVKYIKNFCITNLGIYFLWVIMHHIASHLYVYRCVPTTLLGIIMSPFNIITSPFNIVPAHCYGLRWAIYHGYNSIIAMWTIIGVWLLGRILPLKSE